jgi:hypothetical protein
MVDNEKWNMRSELVVGFVDGVKNAEQLKGKS